MESEEAERVRALGEILREFDLDAVRVKTGDVEIEVVRREPNQPASYVLGMPPAAAPAGLPAAAALAEPAPAGAPANIRKVTAPLVGVFYRAGAPGAPPFVEVGQRVNVGDVLCILEAMKLMNEITSDYAGVVERIVPDNGGLVSLGEELFWIAP